MNNTFDIITPFVTPIAPWMADSAVSEVMVNPDRKIFIEREGVMSEVEVDYPPKQLQRAIRMIARTIGAEIDESAPCLDASLPDGSRVAAVLYPVSLPGPTLTIRKFQMERFTAAELVRGGMMPQACLDILALAVRERANILLSGATGTGKTTVLNALADLIAAGERLLLVEDTSELRPAAGNLVRFQARRGSNGSLPAVTQRDLLKAALRHRPDRILLGEVRGAEAFDLLQAMNFGHDGVISTIHASSAEKAIKRLATCVMMADVGIPYKAVESAIADSLGYVVHLSRRHGTRRVEEILRLEGFDGERITTAVIWRA